MKKKHIVIVVVIVLVWVGIIGFFAIKSKQKEKSEEQNIKKYTIPDEKRTFLNGVVQPIKSKIFYKDSTKGENYTINKENGEFVSKGALLITYKNEDTSNQITVLEDQIKELEKEKSNLNKVSNQSIEKEPVENQIKNTKKELSKLKKQQYSYEYAPFAGIVCISNKEQSGENQSLLKLRSKDLYVKSQVSERELKNISKDQPVEVLILANDKKINGKIDQIVMEPEDQISSVGESTTSMIVNYPVTIKLDSQDNIVNGYHVQAKVKSDKKELEIPKTAIQSEGDKKYVYLVEHNKLEKRFIQTKGDKDKFTIVSSGLKEKDEIVENVNKDMKEGQEVE
ncbi:efflux RND transporter periplasmic adaptor subunit [Paraclostridium sordellii]|uniref:ABC transporter permease n=1 Tax=Paraclostridium sordellii TaxID=1505 RepID=A0A0C7R8V9_PARSO|nr:HlyD family efflux transporter periplasmic adaptor subunit [Paeniclostridium sordellii]CEN80555.1 ABC transporter permease [[Clostridium] sordellii] [Paeniclostridium sordellii]CEO15129.1 ABC transporter permease [[Clostridium] sordellii] [Paeniclostridium sordellii]CEP90068.1 ABC transporter permease [[Clostridium] sordellii] [Paeniclostridium sordellii]CEP98353.1 ABC transporter permease [[Clostridium] sordellii] [Paeniclostridium sordellii]CEQ02104.1 ABC transporter permease [[Clostridiu